MSRRAWISRRVAFSRAPEFVSLAEITAASSNLASAPPSREAASTAAAPREQIRAKMVAALAACAALPYLNILFNAFVYDDHTQVTNNPYLRNAHHLKDIFTTTVWSYVGVQGVTNYYRPMMTLGYLACYRLFGPLAYSFHLASLVLHVLVVCLLFALTEQLTGDLVWSFVASALFAVHPIHTESVAWVAAVTDVELTFFFLLTFIFYVRIAQPEGKRSPGMMAAAVVAFVLALLSKEQALMLPLLATIYEHGYRGDRSRTSFAAKAARYTPLWLLAAAYLLFRIRFLGALAPVHHRGAAPLTEVPFSALALVGQYVGKLLWPARLCAFYVFHPRARLTDPGVLAGLVASIALAALFIALWRSRDATLHFASFGVVWFLVTLAPVLNAHWMAANVFAERYLYLPSVGFCWLVGLAATKLWEAAGRASSAWRRPTLAAVGVVVALLFATRIVIRNRDWRNDIVLYQRTLAASPTAYPILNNLGTVYWADGAADKAEWLWRRALAIHPENTIVLNNLGLAAERRENYQEAISLFRRAMLLKPNYTDPHLDMGDVYLKVGETKAAELQLRAAVALSPLNTRARNELGELYFDSHRLSEAETQFKASVRSEPSATAYDFLGAIDLRRGDTRPAERAFRAALALDSINSKAHFGLGRIYDTAGDTAEALREYQAGLLSDPTDAAAQEAVRKLETHPPR
jgi:protein O-mannosyl-transferase